MHKTFCKDYTQEIFSTKIRGRAITATSRQVAHCSIQKENFYAYQLKRDNWIKSTKCNKRILLSTIPFSLWFVFAFLEININTPSSWFVLYQHLEIYFFLVFPLNFNYLIEAYFEGKCDVFLGNEWKEYILLTSAKYQAQFFKTCVSKLIEHSLMIDLRHKYHICHNSQNGLYSLGCKLNKNDH